jgi:MFS superfamily sulfate permease-like transporter
MRRGICAGPCRWGGARRGRHSLQPGTAHLAGLPPTAGLIAFAAGAIGFAAFGANRFLACADLTIAPIFAGGLATLAATESRDYFALWWPLGRDLKGETIEGVLVIAFQAPLSFLNGYKFQDGARRAARQRRTPLNLIVPEASSIVEIDFTRRANSH